MTDWIENGSPLEALIAGAPSWRLYVEHDFVRMLEDGSLPEACFRHYLAQDYVFLIHFARAFGLAAFKADRIDDVRRAAATLDALINEEMRLHIAYCARYGLDEAALKATIEEPANLAYTRYVMERGLAGDFLDLLTALAPCIAGYGVVGARLLPASRPDHPYREWIETYGGEGYQGVAAAAVSQLNDAAARALGDRPFANPRWTSLQKTFETACRLEESFWAMGLAPMRR